MTTVVVDGGVRVPPSRPSPSAAPPDDLWADFDTTRAGWEHAREPAAL
jgi:hypothetical protein